MNAGTLAQLLGMNQQNTQKLTEAWGQAQKASQGVNSLAGARKAIEAVGMTNEAIAKAGALLNNPLAGVVASAIGLDIGKARRALSALTGTSNEEELEIMDKTVNSYLVHHNMLGQADNSKVIKIVPPDVYTTPADKVSTDFKRKAVNKVLETWLGWEAETAELYTAITYWLMAQHKADYLHFQKLAEDVCHEHEKAKCIYSHAELVGWNVADIESFTDTLST